METRREYRELKDALCKASKSLGIQNKFKREAKKISQKYDKVYKEGTAKHTKKVERLEFKHCTDCKSKNQDKQDELREQWLHSIARGNGQEGNDIPREDIPVYGQVTVDRDEYSYANLPPKYCMYAMLELQKMKFENTLGTTKLRWNRAMSGTPQEQELDAAEAELNPQTEEQLQAQEIVENMSREIYTPATKTADFRKTKVTDMKFNPRVCLQKARPPEKERVLDAKEFMGEATFKEFMENQRYFLI